MLSIAEFFIANSVLFYLVYGLSFFAVGLTLALQSLSPVRPLGMRYLWLLAAFGLARAVVQWIEASLALGSGAGDPGPLRIVELVISAASFTFLLQFGVAMLVSRGARAWLQTVPALLLLTWAAVLVANAAAMGGADRPEWYALGQALIRYAVALPGSLLAAWVLWDLGRSWRGAEAARMSRFLTGAAVTFVLYGVVTGLIAAPAPFFPANVINTETFQQTFGMPVHLWRALLAIAMTYFLIQTYVIEAARQTRTASQLLISLNESSRAIVSKLDLAETLELIVHRAQSLLGTDTSFLSLVSADGQALAMAASVGVRTEALKGLRLDLDQGLAGAAIAAGGPLVVDDYFKAAELKGRALDVIRDEGLISGIAAPLTKDERPLGVLYVFNRQATRFSASDAENLGALAAQASVAIERAALYETEKDRVRQLQELDELKNEFISIASHEFRLPLVVIRRWVELLRSGELSGEEESERALEAIGSEAGRLSALVETVLNVSRIEAGALPFRPQRLPLRSVVDPVVQRMSAQAQARAVRIDVASEDGVEVLADPDLTAEILVNLIGNAIDHAGDRAVVSVRAHIRDGMVVVCVADEGPGIPSDQLPKLFGRFVRLPGLGKSRSLGAGLGLYITKRLVEIQGGRVWAESVVGKGSQFYFTLPAVSAGTPEVAGNR